MDFGNDVEFDNFFGIDIEDAAILAVINNFEELFEDENQREVVSVDIEGWRRLEGVSFKKHFRMFRSTFQKLIIVVREHLVSMNRLKRMRTSLDVALLMTVWVLGNGDTHRSVSSQFGVTRGVEFFHYTIMIEALRELAPRYIRWPSVAERDIIKQAFEERYRYPGVVGCVDGTYIEMTAPLEQPQRYVNRHHRYSILAQAVCDRRLLVRDIYVGEPGSVGDARMFARSPLSDNLLRRLDMLREDEHLLGDGAYILTNKVLISYVNDGHLTRHQRYHNYYLSSCRASIERTFGWFFGKFRRLKFFHNYSIQYAIDHSMSSFVLHNFVILNGEHPDGLFGNGDFVGIHLDAPEDELVRASRNAGVQKREYIARLLFQGEPEEE